MNRPTVTALAIAFGLPLALPSVAMAKPDATKLMEDVENRHQGDDQTSKVALEIKPRRGKARMRRFTTIRKDVGGHTRFGAFFSAPAEVRNSAFLVHDMKKSEDRRWLYLPTIGRVRRLSSGDARASFFGSDFVYEDVTNRDPNLDTHKLIAVGKFAKWDCWVVESTPKKKRGVDFARYRSWVWKNSPLIVRQEFYDKKGTVIRRLEIASLDKIQGIWTSVRGTVWNLKTGSRTRMEVSDTQYNAGVSVDRLSDAQLGRGAP